VPPAGREAPAGFIRSKIVLRNFAAGRTGRRSAQDNSFLYSKKIRHDGTTSTKDAKKNQ
jgi:hypothetical protein